MQQGNTKSKHTIGRKPSNPGHLKTIRSTSKSRISHSRSKLNESISSKLNEGDSLRESRVEGSRPATGNKTLSTTFLASAEDEKSVGNSDVNTSQLTNLAFNPADRYKPKKNKNLPTNKLLLEDFTKAAPLRYVPETNYEEKEGALKNVFARIAEQ